MTGFEQVVIICINEEQKLKRFKKYSFPSSLSFLASVISFKLCPEQKISPTAAMIITLTESFDGTNWTETADLSTSRRLAAQMGASNTSSLIVGGALTAPGARTATTEVWNGTAWTEVNDLNTGRNNHAGAGNVSLGIVFGGNESPTTPYTAKTEAWNGTSWSEVADMATPRQYVKGGGTDTSAIVLGGFIQGPGAKTDATEEWSADDFQIKTMTTS